MTKRGYEQIMNLVDKELAFFLLFLFHRLKVFGPHHWPLFLVEEKQDEAHREYWCNSYTDDPKTTHVWWLAREILRI